MSVTIDTQFDCTQRELVVDIAWMLYAAMGYGVRSTDPLYFYKSQHPQEMACLAVAQDIYEMFVGDSPSYDDEED